MRIKNKHAIKRSKVYHNNSKCTKQNNIEVINTGEGKGKGNRHLCPECKRLNNQGK